MRHLLLIIVLCAAASNARGDSIAAPRPPGGPWAVWTAAGLTAAAGAGAHWLQPHPRGSLTAPRYHGHAVDAAQLVPLALPWALKAAGVETQSGWGRLAVAQATGAAIMAVTVKGLKSTVRSPRPDGSDSRSFPSGHTAWAFLGATSTIIETGTTSPGWALAAWTAASAIGTQRVASGRHYPADVVAGAGVCILAAHGSHALADLFPRVRRQRVPVPAAWPLRQYGWTLAVSPGLSIPLRRRWLGSSDISLLPGYTLAVGATRHIAGRWNLGAAVLYSSHPVLIERCYAGSLWGAGARMHGAFTIADTPRCNLQAHASAGIKRLYTAHTCSASTATATLQPRSGRVPATSHPWTPTASIGLIGSARIAPRLLTGCTLACSLERHPLALPTLGQAAATPSTARLAASGPMACIDLSFHTTYTF